MEKGLLFRRVLKNALEPFFPSTLYWQSHTYLILGRLCEPGASAETKPLGFGGSTTIVLIYFTTTANKEKRRLSTAEVNYINISLTGLKSH